jgi:hypothetical protein
VALSFSGAITLVIPISSENGEIILGSAGHISLRNCTINEFHGSQSQQLFIPAENDLFDSILFNFRT